MTTRFTCVVAIGFVLGACGPKDQARRTAVVRTDAGSGLSPNDEINQRPGGRGGAGGRAGAGGAPTTGGAPAAGGGGGSALGGGGGNAGGAGGSSPTMPPATPPMMPPATPPMMPPAPPPMMPPAVDARAPAPVDAAAPDLRAPAADTRAPAPSPDLAADLRADLRAPEPDTAAACPAEVPATDVIADFSDGKLEVKAAGGRGPQAFQVFTDGTAGTHSIRLDSAGPRCQSTGALRLTGSGYTVWGVALNGLFEPPVNGTWQPYDARAWKGIRFWARAAAPVRVRVKFPDRNTHRTGGVCTKCDDGFGVMLDLTPTWEPFTVEFATTKQQGFGDPAAAIATDALYGVELIAPTETAFDIWLDDLAFVK